MPSVVSGRVVRVDVTTQSGFNYGLILLDSGNQGRMEFRYDMSSRGPVPAVGTYVTITYAEGTPSRIMEIRVIQPEFAPTSSSSSTPIWSSGSNERVASAPAPSSQSLGGFDVSLPEYVKRSPQTGWSARPASTTSYGGIDIEGDPNPRYPYDASHDVYRPTRPSGISIIAGFELLLAAMGLIFCNILLVVFPLLGLLAVMVDLLLFVAAAGLYSMKEWGRLVNLVMAALLSLTIVGLIVGIPILWYLNQEEIKGQFQ